MILLILEGQCQTILLFLQTILLAVRCKIFYFLLNYKNVDVFGENAGFFVALGGCMQNGFPVYPPITRNIKERMNFFIISSISDKDIFLKKNYSP